MDTAKLMVCVLFTLVLVVDFMATLDVKHERVSDILIRGAMVLAFPFLMEWF